MKKHVRWLAVLLAIVLVAAACGDDDSSSDSADSSDSASTEEEAVEQTQGGDLTFHMITHSDDGPFWSVVKRGMEAACADVGVNCVWMPGNNDPGQMVSDIETAIGEADVRLLLLGAEDLGGTEVVEPQTSALTGDVLGLTDVGGSTNGGVVVQALSLIHI